MSALSHDDDLHPLSRLFSWTDDPGVRSAIGLGLGGFTLVLLVLDWAVGRKAHEGMEAIPGVYVAVGFFGFAFAVLSGWVLRALLSRRPDYYEAGPGGGDDG